MRMEPNLRVMPMTMADYDSVYQLWCESDGVGLNDFDDSFTNYRSVFAPQPG